VAGDSHAVCDFAQKSVVYNSRFTRVVMNDTRSSQPIILCDLVGVRFPQCPMALIQLHHHDKQGNSDSS
jgi:hypothetical protein